MNFVDIYSYREYQPFLEAICESKGLRSGYKREIAESMQIQGAYLSRVLKKKVNLNLEQAFRLSKFLGMNEEERSFLFLLIEKERAGTVELQEHFTRQIETAIKRRDKIHSRLSNVDELSSESKAQYYSNWYYLAIHLLAEMESIKTANEISERLKLSLETVNEVLAFLNQHSLIQFENGNVSATDIAVHLAGDSPLVTQHHRNWRLKALQDVGKTDDSNLHFSAATTIDSKTYWEIRRLILKTIEESVDLFQKSPIEDAYSLNIDWYKL